MKEMPCMIYSRVCGYFQPVQSWHKGKQEEYNQRVEYKVNAAVIARELKHVVPKAVFV